MTYFCGLSSVPACDDRAWLESLSSLLCQFETDVQAQLDALIAGNVLGELKYLTDDTDTVSWLLCDGRVISDAGATAPAPPAEARFNADMELLFKHLWEQDINANLTYYVQGGGASSRGASANADWLAGKQITLPDLRGRVLAAMDNPGNGTGSANRITAAWADQFFGSGGAETHQLTVSEMPAHDHVGGATVFGQGVTAGAITLAAGALLGVQIQSEGSDVAHNNIQDTMTAGNYFIFTGAS